MHDLFCRTDLILVVRAQLSSSIHDKVCEGGLVLDGGGDVLC